MIALILPARSPLLRAFRGAGRFALVPLLSFVGACSVLDPTGEWRGLDRELPVAVASATQPTVPRGVRAADPSAALPSRPEAAPARTGSPSTRLDARSAERLLVEAEAHYRGRRFSDAELGFRAVVEAEPRSLHAWLRLGNLSHARGDLEAARLAYQRASAHVGNHSIDQEAREKAFANLAILALEQARLALEGLGGEGHSAMAGERARTLTALVEQRQASLETELRRIVPATSPPRDTDRVGLALSDPALAHRALEPRTASATGVSMGGSTAGRSLVRVESFLPEVSQSR